MPEFDPTKFVGMDFKNFDPAKLDLGTCVQDCALIAQTYERGAHSTYTEAAVFAPLSRTLENSRSFSAAAQTALQGYIRDAAENKVDSPIAVQSGQVQGMSFPGGLSHPTLGGDAFGKTALDWLRNCIPCLARIAAFLELNPHLDLLSVLEADIKARLAALMQIVSLLGNMDMYHELCALLDLLNFMCIPDLQRIIALLATLLAFQALSLDGLIGMLRAIIAPLFMPIFMAISALMDQFSLLVVSPMECILDAINAQLRKLNISQNPNSPVMQAKAGIQEAKNGLNELRRTIIEGKQYILAKVDFYIQQLKAMLGELSLGDVAYTKASLRKLTLIRMIGFVTAIISAIAKGQQICSTAGKKPSSSELDNFFTNFLNPQSPLQFWVDPNGEIHVEERKGQDALPDGLDVVEFDGEKLLNSEVVEQINNLNTAMAKPLQVQLPCRLTTSKEDADLVNRWIEELSSL